MSDTLEHPVYPSAVELNRAQCVLDNFMGSESPLACPQDFSAALAAWCSAGLTCEGIAYDAQGSHNVQTPRTQQQVNNSLEWSLYS